MFRKKNLLESIDVSQSMNLGFDNGWHHPEPDGFKWMDGPSSTIQFHTDGTKKYLEIGCWAGKTAGHRPHSIHIYLNGKQQYKCLAPGNGSKFVRFFPLPKHGRGELKLEFRSEYIWTPSDIEPDSLDTRRLGAIALRYAFLKNSINGTESLDDESNLLESVDVNKTGDLGFKDGWCTSDADDHKWMDGPNSAIYFLTDGEKKYLKICYIAGGNPDQGLHGVDVYANGTYLDAFTVAGNRNRLTRTYQLPTNIKGGLLIEFRSECTWSATDIQPDSPDTRILGAIALRYAVLTSSIIDADSLEGESKLLESIDVRKTGDLGFKNGWNESEAIGNKWMDGRKSSICFLTNGEKKYLEIGYLAGGIPDSGRHDIEVYANGLYLDGFTVAGNRNLFVKTFQLPMSIRGDLLIEFRSDCVWRPKDLDPATTDTRQLGALGLCYAVLQDEPDLIILNQQSVEHEIKEQKTRVSTGPSFMIHGVTNRCNLNCVMCGNNLDDPDLVRGDITEDRLSKVRDNYPNLNFASLSGGEPFLYKGIGDLIKELSINGVRNINFYTNGLLIDQAKRELILEYSDSIDFIAISIDAATKESYKKIRGGNFQKLVGNIRELTRRKAELGLTRPRLVMNFVVTRTNVEEIPALVELAAELHVEEVALQQMLEGMDFTVEKNGFKFDYKKENIRHNPELLMNSIQKAVQIAEQHEVDVSLYPGIYDLYVAQLGESQQGEVVVPRKYIYKNREHDFSSKLIDKVEGGPICKLPWQMMVVVSGGNVFPCCWSNSFANVDDYMNFEDLWNCDRIRKIRHELLNGRFARECRTPNCPAFKRGESVDLTTL